MPFPIYHRMDVSWVCLLYTSGLDTDDIHSPNEHYGLFNFYKGIETIPYYFMYYAEMKKSWNI